MCIWSLYLSLIDAVLLVCPDFPFSTFMESSTNKHRSRTHNWYITSKHLQDAFLDCDGAWVKNLLENTLCKGGLCEKYTDILGGKMGERIFVDFKPKAKDGSLFLMECLPLTHIDLPVETSNSCYRKQLITSYMFFIFYI